MTLPHIIHDRDFLLPGGGVPASPLDPVTDLTSRWPITLWQARALVSLAGDAAGAEAALRIMSSLCGTDSAMLYEAAYSLLLLGRELRRG